MADPAHAASTCVGKPLARATSIQAAMSSQAPIAVPPVASTTPAGLRPASRSARIAASRAPGSMEYRGSSGLPATLTRLFWPIPDRRTALSTELCVWADA